MLPFVFILLPLHSSSFHFSSFPSSLTFVDTNCYPPSSPSPQSHSSVCLFLSLFLSSSQTTLTRSPLAPHTHSHSLSLALSFPFPHHFLPFLCSQQFPFGTFLPAQLHRPRLLTKLHLKTHFDSFHLPPSHSLISTLTKT